MSFEGIGLSILNMGMRCDMNDLYFRPATPDDSEFAYQTKKAAFKEYVDQVWGWDEGQQRALHEARFLGQDFQVIQREGIDVGILALEQKADCLKLNQIFIHPDHQNKGYGTVCMKHLIIEANKNQMPIQLQVMKVNPLALAFYKRLGFDGVSETETHIQMVYHPIV